MPRRARRGTPEPMSRLWITVHWCVRKGSQKAVQFLHQGVERTVSGVQVFQALGRRPNIDWLQLEAAGVHVEDGCIVVDSSLRTSQAHIFAVGDVTNLYDIVHLAIQQGEIAGHNACHLLPGKQFDERSVTEVVYTDPQIAVVGLSERACQARGIAYLTASHAFADHGKALCLGTTQGVCQIVSGAREWRSDGSTDCRTGSR